MNKQPKIYACSDHHFYHKNIIKYANRPFDIEDENCVIDNAKLMIERHNQIVTDDDYVLIVGDLSAGLRGREEHFKQIIKLLKGKKILIRGNHDHLSDEFYLDAGFEKVVDNILIEPYLICHYPCIKSKYSKKPELDCISILKNNRVHTIIHGHIHNTKAPETDNIKRINVSVDYEPNNYFPVELTQPEILNYFNIKGDNDGW